jgi:phosphomannomutase/phosphoglucomutase
MITGSHNPAEFNGFKLCVDKSTIHGSEIQELRRLMEDLGSRAGGSGERLRGTLTHHPILPDYVAELKSRFADNGGVPLTVVLDAGNGTAGLAAPAVIHAMGCKVIELFSEPDGTFPNHHPDPTIPKNLDALVRTVKDRGADIGVAFDGDADRIGVVDEQGSILWGDQLMVLFARDILAERKGATFVSEVKCSQTMYDDIRRNGGTAIMWKTGHSLIKAKMQETGAALAGEMSGHLFFADRYYGYDDAIYAACRVVELLRKARKSSGKDVTLSSLLADLPRTFSTPEIRFECPDAIKFKVVDRMQKIYADGKGIALPLREVITVDGVRAVFKNGWGLIRASNTQPVLVMRFEAPDEPSLQQIRAIMEDQVRSVVKSLS